VTLAHNKTIFVINGCQPIYLVSVLPIRFRIKAPADVDEDRARLAGCEERGAHDLLGLGRRWQAAHDLHWEKINANYDSHLCIE